MPAIVGPVQIVSVTDGIIQFGDSFVISPKASSKSASGSGAANTGVFIITNNGLSANNILNVNGIDHPIAANN